MIKKYLKEKHHLNNYEIAQVEFVFKTVSSELSKMMIMGILFHEHLGLYLFALCVMLYLRSTTGGVHFYTYTGCLAASILYMGLTIILLRNIVLPVYLQLIALFLCILICYWVGPIVSKYRQEPSPQKFCQ